MTRLFLCIASLLSFSTLFAQDHHHKEQAYHVEIYQDGKLVPHMQGVYQLEKKPFQVQVHLVGVEGVYVYADNNDSIYKTPHSQPIPGFADLRKNARAELKASASQELKLDKNWAYWLYNTANNSNSFHEVKKSANGHIYAYKTIKQLSINGQKVNVEQASAPVYFFFVALDQENPSNDIGRIKVKINWK